MKTRSIVALGSVVFGMVAGCVGSGVAVQGTVDTALRTRSQDVAMDAPTVAPRSLTLATATDALACMSGPVDASSRCAGIARTAGLQPGSLERGEQFAQDEVAELLTRQSHEERLPSVVRTDLLSWFDRAAGAAREGRRVAEGAAGHQLALVARRDDGHPALEAVEEARRADAADAATYGQLEALFTFTREHADSALAADFEASALLMLSQRAEEAAGAQAEVRDEALRALAGLVQRIQPDHVATASNDRAPAVAASAHRTSGAETLAATRALLTERLTAVGSRVVSPSLREAAMREADRDRGVANR